LLKLLKYTFLISFVPQIVLANIPQSPAQDYVYLSDGEKYHSKDIKQAKYLEDFYWAFRNQNLSWMNKSLKNFNPKSDQLLRYKSVLNHGFQLARQISNNKIDHCLQPKGFDYISKKYFRLFKQICTQEKITHILNSKGQISDNENDQNFLLRNDYILTHRRYKNLLLNKIKSSNLRDKTFFSNYIKQYIYEHSALPNIEFMEYMDVDSKITLFIQQKSLFDKQDSHYFTNEFKRLISEFRSDFLEGDTESASNSLDNAIQFYTNNEDKINNAKAWKLFFYNGKKVARTIVKEEEAQDLALNLFKFSEKVAEEENLFDSKFQSLITYYQSNQLGEAISFINKNKFLQDFDKLTPQLRFWSAYIYDKKNEKVQAKELYLKQISLSPLNYYSILALKQLRNINDNYDSDIIIKSDNFKGIDKIALTKEASSHLALFNIFSNAGSSFLTSLQGRQLRNLAPHKFFALENDQNHRNKKNFLLSYFSHKKEYLLSFKQAYSALRRGDIELTPTVISGLFPQIYKDIIKEQKSSLDPRLVLSLIRQESAFNRKAKSVVGARGLMQLMPATARMFKRRLKTYQLYDPNLNIKIGTKFLERLVKRYDGNLMLTLSAYNAGMGNVAKWQKSIPFSDDILLNVELIPFSETRKYVKLIYRNLFFYKYLDQDINHLDLDLADTFKVSYNL
tara:strand:+ start:59939 stop:61975 length:2037 start_codon:yes stop_codon:yes gene_type:complete